MDFRNLVPFIHSDTKRSQRHSDYIKTINQIHRQTKMTLGEIKENHLKDLKKINELDKIEIKHILKKQDELESELNATLELLVEQLGQGKNTFLEILKEEYNIYESLLLEQQNKAIEYYNRKGSDTKSLKQEHEKKIINNKEFYQETISKINKKCDESQKEIKSFGNSIIEAFHELTNKIINQTKKRQQLNIGIMTTKQKKHEFKLTRNKKIIYSVIASVIAVSSIMAYVNWQDSGVESSNIKSSFVIQNLRGDTIDTWVAWQTTSDRIFQVNLVNSPEVTPERLSIIRDTIMSQETLEIDDSLLHKGPQGQTSTYYVGWAEALQSIQTSTQYPIPTNIVFGSADREIGDVVINLTNDANADGYTAYTTAIADESNHQMLKAKITVYEIDRLSDADLSTIVRHEMGHAFGLAHSTAPEDLMHPVIATDYPYISECDIDAIVSLYDGSQNSQVICEK